MTLKNILLYVSLLFFIFLSTNTVQAQERDDSLAQQTIDIYHVYQPKLPAAAKINLNAELPKNKKSTPNLVYSLPSQNLNFSYTPIPLQPLAMGIDTSHYLLHNNYIKAGFGNYGSPLLQLGLSNGNKHPFQYGLNAGYTSAKGEIEDQQYSRTNILLHGKYFTPTHALNAQLSYKGRGVRYYGYDHKNPPSSKDSIKQNYSTISFKIGGKNIKSNRLGIDYQPEIGFYTLFDKYHRTENAFLLNIPIQKYIGSDIFIGATFKADLSKYKGNDSSFSNNIVSIEPSFNITKPKFKLRAGVVPTWSQGEFYLLPDILNETNLIGDKIILSSGWTVYFNKNSYQNIIKENPFVQGIWNLENTRVAERYTGIKGAINNHFTYNVKIASVDYYHRPLYLVNAARHNRFQILEEETLKSFELHAELGYTLGKKFSAKLSSTWFNFYDQETEAEPWGMRPFESNLSLKYSGIRNLGLSADLYALSGSWYQPLSGDPEKTNATFDINLGGDYNITPQFSVWIKANNLLDTHYERWNQYPSLGLHLIGGLMFTF